MDPAPGSPATTAELAGLGFVVLVLKFRPTTVQLAEGPGCEWTTIGDVPAGPGIYAFTRVPQLVVTRGRESGR